MKKLLVCTALVMIVLCSCQKEDGVYSPKKQISRIYSEVQFEDTVIQRLREVWTWNDEQLVKIDYFNNDSAQTVDWTETFIYTDGRLTRVQDSEGEYIDYLYEDKQLVGSNVYDDSILSISTTLTYDGKKISRIDITYYEDEKSPRLSMFKGLFPQQVETIITKQMAQHKISATKENELCYQELTWDGNNISKISFNENGCVSTHEMTYDNKNNPYEGFLGIWGINYPNHVENFGNRNNILKLNSTYNFGDDVHSSTFEYEYEYDGKYPTKCSSVVTSVPLCITRSIYEY